MKKIVLFIDNLGSGGAQRQIVNLGILLKNKGYNVSVLVYADLPFYKDIVDKNNIPLKIIDGNNYLLRIIRVRAFLRKCGADVVIAFLETPGFLACISKIGGAKWKLITSELSAKMETFTDKKTRFYNVFERYSDAKVCNSENAKKMWEHYYPQYREMYRVIYNPVILSTEDNLEQEKNEKDNKVLVTVAASYQELKNPLGVIEALNLLSEGEKEKLRIKWYGRKEVVTGDTSIYERAVQKIEEYGLQDTIQLNAETSNIYQLMLESDAVGLFSTVEGLPNAICEGMMLGKPIIMSRVSDYEILSDGNGILCDAESPESIKCALQELLNCSDEKLQEMGACSKKKAERLFSEEVVGEQWFELIERLTNNG